MKFSPIPYASLLICAACFIPQKAVAQLTTSPRISWEEFVTEYAEGYSSNQEGEAATLSAEEYDYLENLVQTPLQLNRAEREELLRIPFLNEEQTDTLLAYRTRRKGILAMGELMLLKNFDYTTRRWLSLFARCDSAFIKPPYTNDNHRLFSHKFSEGKHEVETRIDIPFYKREGQKHPSKPTASNYFVGNAVHHVLRYRYNLKKELAYGLTIEKDAGEPVGKKGFYPYDYQSAYLYLNPKHRSWSFIVGDFEMRGGRGLIYGKQFFGSRALFASRQRTSPANFKPHTSTDEASFFRGGAFSFSKRSWHINVFASYRKLDARIENDTARIILSTGLHRTMNEISRRRNLGCFTSGTTIGLNKGRWGIELLGCYAHYDKTVSPTPRFYNTNYFRGQNYGGGSAFYFFKIKRFTLQGETALDHNLHLATEHVASLVFSRKLWLNMQYRNLASKFVSIYGDCLQQLSRTSNEEGLMVGFTYQPNYKLCITTGADAFRFKRPTYTTRLRNAKGIEAYITIQKTCESSLTLTANYRIKSRQRTITGHELLEYRVRQQMGLSITKSNNQLEWNVALKGAMVSCQTASRSLGVLASGRFTWKATERLRLRGFAGLFITDDYQSSLYTYEPRLLRTGGTSSFFNHGAHLSLTADIRPVKHIVLSPLLSSTRYFNLSEQSSGVSKIHSPWKNDVSLQMRLLF